ncbi:hypothetical protein [Conexibacter sp. DBS9H8]|uniref:hypothetical protein n=1 Tax=Conexibacter sp. DBS9H8 TaxID=2937801 RepID=UPI00200D8C18|nr:hypothetical protein [Conexibacter sp. DBS9H8]
MASADLKSLEGLRAGSAPPALFARTITLGRLEAISFLHSCIYLGLLVCAFILANPQPVTTVLGFGHGLLWIAMSLVCIGAARYRIIPWWLAVCVAVLGGIGPFFGTGGFVIESRRRAAATAGSLNQSSPESDHADR